MPWINTCLVVWGVIDCVRGGWERSDIWWLVAQCVLFLFALYARREERRVDD